MFGMFTIYNPNMPLCIFGQNSKNYPWPLVFNVSNRRYVFNFAVSVNFFFRKVIGGSGFAIEFQFRNRENCTINSWRRIRSSYLKRTSIGTRFCLLNTTMTLSQLFERGKVRFRWIFCVPKILARNRGVSQQPAGLFTRFLGLEFVVFGRAVQHFL